MHLGSVSSLLEVQRAVRLTPPPRRLPDALDAELEGMVESVERGFPRLPPPPAPIDRGTLAKLEAKKLANYGRRDLDAIQILARALPWLLFAAIVFFVWRSW